MMFYGLAGPATGQLRIPQRKSSPSFNGTQQLAGILGTSDQASGASSSPRNLEAWFHALPAPTQKHLQKGFGEDFLEEFFCLSQEKDARVFYAGLLQIGQRLEDNDPLEQEAKVYSALIAEGPHPYPSPPRGEGHTMDVVTGSLPSAEGHEIGMASPSPLGGEGGRRRRTGEGLRVPAFSAGGGPALGGENRPMKIENLSRPLLAVGRNGGDRKMPPPPSASKLKNLGVALRGLNEAGKTIPTPKEIVLLLQLAKIFYRAGWKENGKEILLRAEELTASLTQPRQALQSTMSLGETQAALGRNAQARKHYRRAMEIIPQLELSSQTDPWAKLGVLQHLVGDSRMIQSFSRAGNLSRLPKLFSNSDFTRKTGFGVI